MNFIGKICPYCKSEFKENDDVVICSICEMPHHKECWIENKACTTFGCTGTIMGTVNQNNSKVCTECNSVHTQGEEFCTTCGSVLFKPEQQLEYVYSSIQQQSLNYDQSQYTNQAYNVNYGEQNANYNSFNEASTNDDILTFVGVNQEYYFSKFQKFNLNNSKISWNWASAFLGAYWYAYRKMFLFQFLYYVAYFSIVGFFGALLLGIFEGATRNAGIGIIIMIMIPILVVYVIPFVISGMFGNIIYRYHVERYLKKARYMDTYMKKDYLMKKGGTSKAAVWVLIGLGALLRVLGNL